MRHFETQRNRQDKHIDNMVDRVEFLSEWKNSLEWQPKQVSKILIFSGIGGIGKTTLCEMAIEE